MSRRGAPAHGKDVRSAAELVVERVRLVLARWAGEEKARGAAAIDRQISAVDRQLAGEPGAYRARLVSLFGLSDAERDALDLAVAVAAEPALGQALPGIQGLPRHLPCEIALRLLFGRGPAPVVWGGSPLVSWGLVDSVQFASDEPLFFRADPAVVDWYFGTLSASAIPLRRAPAVEPLPEWRIEGHAGRIRTMLNKGLRVRIAIAGRRATGRASFAACLAHALSKPAICVDAETVADDPGASIFLRLQRLALLGDLVLIWRGAPHAWPGSLPVAWLQFVTQDVEDVLTPVDGIIDLRIELPPLSAETSAVLYRRHLPKLAGDAELPLGRPRIGDLVDAAAQGISTGPELRSFLRQRNGARTSHIGRVVSPDVSWGDLILAERTLNMLKAFADEARGRAGLLADPERRRVFADAAHLSALLSGPPGLGKSMSARVIAKALKIDLLVVDAAAITSKFIGDTAKNLSLCFEIARDCECGLLFEEADNFFTTRVKVETANDRHSNADIGHLLQLMEGHDGVVLLSTNKRTNIDAAFTRRLRFIIEFKKPVYEERLQLWDRMLSLLGMPQGAREALAPRVAAAHELTPAQIKGAALTAAYRAAGRRAITTADVEDGVRLEFQKEGRLVSAVAAAELVRREAGNG